MSNLNKVLAEMIEAGDLETAAAVARQKRDKLLLEVDAHGSVYRMELERPEGETFKSWLPVLEKLASVFEGPWAVYRRALLDVPQQEGFPGVIEWPEKPE